MPGQWAGDISDISDHHDLHLGCDIYDHHDLVFNCDISNHHNLDLDCDDSKHYPSSSSPITGRYAWTMGM